MYKTIGILVGVVAITAGLTMAVPDARGAEDLKAQIEAANRVFMEAFAKNDAAGVAACYTADAQMLPDGADFVTGKPAIQERLQKGMQGDPVKLTLITGEVEAHGDTAIEVGRSRVENSKGVVVDEGKYIVIWKRVDGKWKLHRDIFNSNAKPAQ